MAKDKLTGTRALLKKVGADTEKGKAIIQAITDNSTGWTLIDREEKPDGSGASRRYQCVMNGHICCHDIWTPKNDKGEWMEQDNVFSLLIEPSKKFDHVLEAYDYAMSLPKGQQSVTKVVDFKSFLSGN